MLAEEHICIAYPMDIENILMIAMVVGNRVGWREGKEMREIVSTIKINKYNVY